MTRRSPAEAGPQTAVPDRSVAHGPRRPIPIGTIWRPAKGATCRDCGAEIRFRLTRGGRWQPVDEDETPHGATCTARKRAPRSTCPRCSSPLFETIYTDIPAPHFAKGHCTVCDFRWWIGRPRAEGGEA